MFINLLYSTLAVPSTITSWSDAVTVSFLNFMVMVMGYLPNVIGALIVLFFGWAIAMAMGKLVLEVLKTLHLRDLLSKTGILDNLEKAGAKIDLAVIISGFVKWFIILVFLTAATEILLLRPVADFLQFLLFVFVAKLVIAIVIISIGLVLADLAYRMVKNGAKAFGIGMSEMVAMAAKWAILIIAILTALEQLGVQIDLLKILFTGIVSMLAIAGGLAFGLGGQYKAREVLENMSKESGKK